VQSDDNDNDDNDLILMIVIITCPKAKLPMVMLKNVANTLPPVMQSVVLDFRKHPLSISSATSLPPYQNPNAYLMMMIMMMIIIIMMMMIMMMMLTMMLITLEKMQ
jgi:hypothetical protein